MKERERVTATGLTVLMLVVWLGFLVHRSPRFAGSPWGGVLGVSGAICMLVPLAYMFVKRFKRLKKRLGQLVSMRTLLAWHIYAGIAGPILVLLHTGHKFESPLGIALTAMTLIVVVSGFAGRYLMSQWSTEIRLKKAMLTEFNAAYRRAASELASDPLLGRLLRPFSGFFGRLLASLFASDAAPAVAGPAAGATNPVGLIRLAESIADLEYAIRTHETFKRWFSKWLKFHIVISMILYGLMALHVWAAIHFGLRWFEPSPTDHFSSSRAAATPAAPLDGSADAGAEFAAHFGQLVRRHWRPSTTIHGIRTTVFAYADIAREASQPQSDFSQSLAALRRVTPDDLEGADRKKAFWINVYNFGAIKLAAQNYPVTSITDPKIAAGDPWGVRSIRVGDGRYSLKQIENEILLKQFDDRRIVFAVSCAAVSCPDRSDTIFSGPRINEQLDTIIRRLFANPTKGLSIDREGKIVTISWILKADRRLFDGRDGVLDFVRAYAPPDTAEWIDAHRPEIRIEYFEHDWGLNDVALAESND